MKIKFSELKVGERFTFPKDKTIYLKTLSNSYRLLDMSSWPFKTMQKLCGPDEKVIKHAKQYVHPMNIEAPF